MKGSEFTLRKVAYELANAMLCMHILYVMYVQPSMHIFMVIV